MSREIRRVPANWSHPTDAQGRPIPLLNASSRDAWAQEDPEDRPADDAFMPAWTPEEATHFMAYETTTEGTPISPAFPTAEALARWLADTGASVFADFTASYEEWLALAEGKHLLVRLGKTVFV